MEINVTPEQQSFFNSRLQAGTYNTTNEVLSDALLALAEKEQHKNYIKSAINSGWKQAQNGEFLSSAELIQHISARRNKLNG